MSTLAYIGVGLLVLIAGSLVTGYLVIKFIEDADPFDID